VCRYRSTIPSATASCNGGVNAPFVCRSAGHCHGRNRDSDVGAICAPASGGWIGGLPARRKSLHAQALKPPVDHRRLTVEWTRCSCERCPSAFITGLAAPDGFAALCSVSLRGRPNSTPWTCARPAAFTGAGNDQALLELDQPTDAWSGRPCRGLGAPGLQALDPIGRCFPDASLIAGGGHGHFMNFPVTGWRH
jgi:hypothetical protein